MNRKLTVTEALENLERIKGLARSSDEKEDSLKKKRIAICAEIDAEISLLSTERFDVLWKAEKRAKAEYYAALKNSGVSETEISKMVGVARSSVHSYITYGGVKLTDEIRSRVRERDKSKCRKCRVKTVLHTHHIEDSTNHSLENLISLCPKHHKLAHHGKIRTATLLKLARTEA